MSNSRSDTDPGTEARAECNTPCKVCETLLEAAEVVRAYHETGKSSNTKEKVDIWDMPDEEWTITASELPSRCHNHETFLSPYLSLPEYKTLTSIEITFTWGNLRLHAFFPCQGDITSWRYAWVELLLLLEKTSGPGFVLARRFDDGFIDIGLLNQWKRSCDEDHGNKCSDRLATLAHPLSYLIDTQQMCLVPAAPDMVYVALSYVWGQVRMLKATRENLERLQQPNALQTLEGQLPRTIRDSIALVPLLEERYLWVDSLCIPQDDEKVAQLNISQMAAIFENASLTIVACDGNDAEFGLRGLRHSSQPRSLPGLLPLAPGITLTTRSEDILGGTPWSRRGWTLQEQIFSRRSIIFYENTIQWICRSSRHYEDVDSPLDSPPDLPAGAVGDVESHFEQLNPLDLSLNVPDLSILCMLIANYSGRDLTYQEDVMSAFVSTFGAMQRAFPRGFIQGLPVSFFDASLIWRSEAMVRRESSRDGAKIPPSWTWAGWKGKILITAWTSATYLKNAPSLVSGSYWEAFQVIPMLVWHTKDSRDSEDKPIPFQNEWHDYKCKFMGKAHDLPEGWISFPIDRLPGYHRGEAGNDAPGPQFQEDPRVPDDQRRAANSLLLLRTRVETRAVVLASCPDRHQPGRRGAQAGRAEPPHRDDQVEGVPFYGDDFVVLRMFGLDLWVKVVLRDQAGAIVGELCPDSVVELKRIIGACPSAIPVDVVAISRGLHFRAPQPVEKETWSFYNVLWVEWEDGIAYRKGIGRVKRSAWERVEKEDISLVMG
ncbi:hypothetical protein PG991_010698 [Apiospora marii]|uniref:Heterokaryon incompatibility domain-containing protein n=1 Tax=Apiospora marii TaxID=335849 RepID=A0ABR1RD60_9PEZI